MTENDIFWHNIDWFGRVFEMPLITPCMMTFATLKFVTLIWTSTEFDMVLVAWLDLDKYHLIANARTNEAQKSCSSIYLQQRGSGFTTGPRFETKTKSHHPALNPVPQELMERLNICTSVTAMITCRGISVTSCNYPGSCGSETCRLSCPCLLLTQIRSFPVYLCG